MGESPALHASGSHHSALAENANQYKAAQSSLFAYNRRILTYIEGKCKRQNCLISLFDWSIILLAELEFEGEKNEC